MADKKNLFSILSNVVEGIKDVIDKMTSGPLKPNVKLYDTFSEWVENRKKQASEDSIKIQSTLQRNWYRPGKKEEASSQDVKDIPDMFPRDDCQEAYVEYLQGKRMPIDATAAKYQNGIISADEQAYRIRHASIPRSLAAGQMSILKWKRGILPKLFVSRIQVWDKLAMEDYNAKNE